MKSNLLPLQNEQKHYIPIYFYWESIWQPYMAGQDITALMQNLILNLDETSIQYVQKFILLFTLLPHKDNMLLTKRYAWTQKDFELMDLGAANFYGLHDILKNILPHINGKLIIDGGAYDGETSSLFNKIFPDSHIFAFEPLEANYIKLTENISSLSLAEKVSCHKLALSDNCSENKVFTVGGLDSGASLTETYVGSTSQSIQCTSIDKFMQDSTQKVGLLKLDVEGYEKKALLGAIKTIKKDRPIIIAAIYHNPVDFFEIKPFLENLNLGYRFIIRRSELVIPMSDLVLIAY